jgi:hypothetical protein
MSFSLFFGCLLSAFPLLAAPQQALEDALQKQLASVEKQRHAIRVQRGDKAETLSQAARSHSAAYFIDPLVPVVSQPAILTPSVSQMDCPPLADYEVSELITAAAQKQDLNPAVLRAVMRQESAFKPCAISSKGAQGLMQLMPATARELHVSDSFDPAQNVHAGAAYLKQLLNRYNGDLRLALVGYNAGPGRADQASAAPYPLETQNYIETILAQLGLGQPAISNAQADEEESMPAAANSARAFSLPAPVPPLKNCNPISPALNKLPNQP